MMRTDGSDGGPAFPTLDHNGQCLVLREWGMSLRDWFAGNERIGDDVVGLSLATALMVTPCPTGDVLGRASWWAEAEAKYKYLRADAMLRARDAT